MSTPENCTHDCGSCSAACDSRGMDPSQFQEKLSPESSVKKVIGVVSGKGGVGKSLVTSLMACRMRAENFRAADLSIEKNADIPQILIYHTHSQETYADYPENSEADVIHLGECLAKLLREKGYNVYHDESVYDYRNGKLDRSAAYTYALDGISGLLQKYPSIEVVLDVHRDGVSDGTRLVTEIDGTETAKIMFFNGTSMSPDGPIEYLPNPNLKENLAFSFQMQLLAAGKYPGLTRKIYLKGLRYNEHVRARSALIEVGAQTNTYAEAKAAMMPLSDLLDQVLTGE